MAKKTSAKKDVKDKAEVNLESQDDKAYITGQHSGEEREKQVKSPTRSRRGAAHIGSVKEEGDGERQKE